MTSSSIISRSVFSLLPKAESLLLSSCLVVMISFNAYSQLESYGSVLHGENLNDLFGFSTALNAAGDIMAVGAPNNSSGGANSGQVKVFQFLGNDWVQLGADIVGNLGGQLCGSAIDLNFAGDRIAIGCPFTDGPSQNVFTGSVRVFEWDGMSWNQLGNEIYGLTNLEESGSSLSIDSEGNTLAIASPCYENTAWCSGAIRIYELIEDDWIQKGSLLEGLMNDRAKFGESLEISGDGNTLIAGGTRNNFPYDTLSAFAMVYTWNDSDWIQYGETFISDHQNRWSGLDVAISENGSTVAISDCWSNLPTEFAQYPRGVVRVYDLLDNQLTQRGETINNYTNGYEGLQLQMTLDGNTLFISADDFNSQWNGYDYQFVNWNGESWVSEEYDPSYGDDFFDRSQKMNGYASVVVTGEHIFGRWPNEWHGAIKAFSTPTLSTSSLEENNLNRFKLFPNPTEGRLTIVNTGQNSFQNDQIQIYDGSGRLVYTASLRGTETILEISNLENGVYLAKILTDKQGMEITKILIQH